MIHADGKFLGEWNCFQEAKIYGMDIVMTSATRTGVAAVWLTSLTKSSDSYILMLTVKMNCSNMSDIGECQLQQNFSLSQSTKSIMGSDVMLHSIKVNTKTDSIYVACLPGKVPPLKFVPVNIPPQVNVTMCPKDNLPPPWPIKWNATALLTPFTEDDLRTAEIQYSAEKGAMLVRTSIGNTDESIKEFLTVHNTTYILKFDTNNNATCVKAPYLKWIFPLPNWLNSHMCRCIGSEIVSDIDTVLWQCQANNTLVDWYWFHTGTGRPWRMFLNDDTNPSLIPVLGNYSTVTFASQGDDVAALKEALALCMINKRTKTQQTRPRSWKRIPYVQGSSYKPCHDLILPPWPKQFYLTASMLPVGMQDPFPTQIIYDSINEAMFTRMVASYNNLYEAILVKKDTYIISQYLNGSLTCDGHLNIGPPVLQWMSFDKCKCMGFISENKALSPLKSTVIAVCPLQGKRVFWTWFSFNERFYPIIFYETSAPSGEGTSLSFAQYYNFYPDFILIDMLNFKVPSKCL